MLTENLSEDQNRDFNLRVVTDIRETEEEHEKQETFEKQEDPILKIKTNLIQQEEFKVYGNRLIEDSKIKI